MWISCFCCTLFQKGVEVDCHTQWGRSLLFTTKGIKLGRERDDKPQKKVQMDHVGPGGEKTDKVMLCVGCKYGIYKKKLKTWIKTPQTYENSFLWIGREGDKT